MKPGTRAAECDAGVSLLEVVIAMAIFSIGVTAVLGLFLNTTGVVRDNIRRTAAAALMNQKLEEYRTMTKEQLSRLIIGRTSLPTQTVNNVEYSLVQNVRLFNAGGSDLCTSSGPNSARLGKAYVDISVSWPNMGRTKPVQGRTYVESGISSRVSGAFRVQVKDQSGVGVGNVKVAVKNASPGLNQETDDGGCTIFSIPDGSYKTEIRRESYVGSDNNQIQSQDVSVLASSPNVPEASFVYEPARSLKVELDAPTANYVMPPQIPLRVSWGAYSEVGLSRLCANDSSAMCYDAFPGTIRNLFPGNYRLKAGICSNSGTTGTSEAGVDVVGSPGDVPTVKIPMAAVTVAVSSLKTGQGVSGRLLKFRQEAGGGCPTAEEYSLTSSSPQTTVLLPFGVWTVSVAGSTSPATATPTPAMTSSPTNSATATPSPSATATPSASATATPPVPQTPVTSRSVTVSKSSPTASAQLTVAE
ncbi:prepilin-type N-terminal cleavage/methylation domain-containing protein [Kineosporia babensis]|uniref:Prepilin-type N-terminal cleavage/methylation domain-containing protein n=1 Tax=Kineosporia babensis TaxID=499548 RepID=A0A9X1NJW7_9ACTN|nr:prepilin-type N-terminal cleavage/methylation domain-containing protein [Kineosporia babensis]MCD5316352.1 prepilin-type N-terminal cleavage/methylation domain-containing protein [Kineosporia babensis]